MQECVLVFVVFGERDKRQANDPEVFLDSRVASKRLVQCQYYPKIIKEIY